MTSIWKFSKIQKKKKFQNFMKKIWKNSSVFLDELMNSKNFSFLAFFQKSSWLSSYSILKFFKKMFTSDAILRTAMLDFRFCTPCVLKFRTRGHFSSCKKNVHLSYFLKNFLIKNFLLKKSCFFVNICL